MRVGHARFDATAGEDLGDRKVVYFSSTNTVKMAKADSINSLTAIGITRNSALNGEEVRVQTDDLIEGFTGLIAGDTYYLSQETVGEITNIRPSSGIIVEVGTAKSTTELNINIAANSFGGFLPGVAGYFGSELLEQSSEVESSTTSTDYQNKINYTTPSLPIGKYRFGFCFEAKIASSAHQYSVRLLIDDVEAAISTENNTGNELYELHNGFKYLNFDSAITHTVKLQWKTSHPSKIAKIRRARVEIWRVS